MINGRIIADLHTHNDFSFDCHMPPEQAYAATLKNGADILAVTNHFDIDGVLDGIYGSYDADADRRALESARETYAGRLRIIRGIELGQPHHRPREAQEFLARNDFEYVLLSLHNMRDVPDFYFWDFKQMTDEMCRYWLERYFSQTLELLDFARENTGRNYALAHLTYPYRYMRQAGRTVDFIRFRDKLAAIFEKLVSHGIALEVNTSGYRQGLDMPMPHGEIVALYRECGGELTVVGSDAHKPEEFGDDITRAYELLRDCGFTYTCVPSRGGFERLAL